MNPVLLERQIKRLAEAAESLVKSLPVLDIKPLINGNNKKRISKDIEVSVGCFFSSFFCVFDIFNFEKNDGEHHQ